MMFKTHTTTQLVEANAWLFEWASIPLIVSGGLSAILWGVIYTFDDNQETVFGVILFIIGIAAIVIRAYTMGT
jgi:hypothetical protein